jgi:hypothetical protein
MKTLKLTLATLLFVTSITFDEQILKTSDNVLISKWSVSFGIQTSHALIMAPQEQFLDINFE